MATMKFAETVESTGNEVDFMKDVIAYITGINNAITCEDDPDDEYDVETVGTDHIPTFRFLFNNEHILTIRRSDKLSDGASYMYFTFISNGNIISDNNIVGFMYSGKAWSYNTLRQFKMSYIEAPGLYIINAVSYSISNSFVVLFAEAGNSNYGSYKYEGINSSSYTISNIFNISQCVLYDNSNPVQGSFLSRFAYKAQPGKVDYIKSSIYANNNIKQFDLTSIYDCTEVSPGSAVSIKDGAYLAVGPHQLVKVS